MGTMPGLPAPPPPKLLASLGGNVLDALTNDCVSLPTRGMPRPRAQTLLLGSPPQLTTTPSATSPRTTLGCSLRRTPPLAPSGHFRDVETDPCDANSHMLAHGEFSLLPRSILGGGAWRGQARVRDIRPVPREYHGELFWHPG
jgi:hypothetical protein